MGLNCNIPKLLPIGSELVCADNSGAKKLQIIGFVGYQGTKRRRLTGGVGSVVKVTVKKGSTQLKKKMHYALIIRQKYPILRKKGPILGKVMFQDNAAILLDSEKNLNKSFIKGVVARQVTAIKRYNNINGVLR